MGKKRSGKRNKRGPVKIPDNILRTIKQVPFFIELLTETRKSSINNILAPFTASEKILRHLYAQQPNHKLLEETLVNVLPIFQHKNIRLQIRPYPSSELIFKPLPVNGFAIEQSLNDFKRNWNGFSHEALKNINWNNIVVAGGSITRCLLPRPTESDIENTKEYYIRTAPQSDIDIFIHGLGEQEALQKIKEIWKSLHISRKKLAVRTKNTITVITQYPYRHIQIICRLYTSISEILTGFDVDCACVAYDGEQVYGSPRAIAALASRCNTIDLSRRSTTYEDRLIKYGQLGFQVYWPSLHRGKVNKSMFMSDYRELTGLARLLYAEKHGLDDRILHAAAYSSFDDIKHIPYGPHVDLEKVMCYLIDRYVKHQESNRYLHFHRFFFSYDIEDIFGSFCPSCPSPTDEEQERVQAKQAKTCVSGRLSFVADNPGRQEIGSFYPLTDTDWSLDAYTESFYRPDYQKWVARHSPWALSSFLKSQLEELQRCEWYKAVCWERSLNAGKIIWEVNGLVKGPPLKDANLSTSFPPQILEHFNAMPAIERYKSGISELLKSYNRQRLMFNGTDVHTYRHRFSELSIGRIEEARDFNELKKCVGQLEIVHISKFEWDAADIKALILEACQQSSPGQVADIEDSFYGDLKWKQMVESSSHFGAEEYGLELRRYLRIWNAKRVRYENHDYQNAFDASAVEDLGKCSDFKMLSKAVERLALDGPQTAEAWRMNSGFLTRFKCGFLF